MPISDSEFIDLITRLGTQGAARELRVGDRRIRARRARIEQKTGAPIVSGSLAPRMTEPKWLELEALDGHVLVGGDAHFWPGLPTTAWRAFVEFARTLSPLAVVINGDAVDGASISRHPPINWERTPKAVEELEATKERLAEVEEATNAPLVWTLGNHDQRLESRLASTSPEFAGVHGVHLKDHFPSRWQSCYALRLNGDVVVKHRYKGGIHAIYNNVLHAGCSIITNHLHSLNVRAFTDYRGTRWAADAGMLGEPYGPQFMYCEDNPRDWRSGFIVLTFSKGQLLRPEPVDVHAQGVVSFRGELMDV